MLQAADFEHELLSAKLIYLSENSEVRVVVMENQAYRFLLMGNTIQSVMDKTDPQKLVFAHQQVMLRSLPTLAPGSRVLELGLGGGSAVRYAQLRRLPVHWTSVEQSSEMINLYWCYFEPAAGASTVDTPPVAPHIAEFAASSVPGHVLSVFTHHIELAGGHEYLSQLPTQAKFELILCDVYDELSLEFIRLCVTHLADNGQVVINWLPHMQSEGAQSALFFARLARELNLYHHAERVEGFANQIHRLRLRR